MTNTEPDDNVWWGSAYSNSLDVNQTIDNVLDSDWIQFTTGSENYWYYEWVLDNVPSGTTYAAVIYDDSMNSLYGLDSTGAETVTLTDENMLEKNTTYFIQVFSLDGLFDASQAYNLRLTPKYVALEGSTGRCVTPAGNFFEILNGKAYVDGVEVDLTWSTSSRLPATGLPYTSRSQEVSPLTGGITIVDGYTQTGSYTGYTATGRSPIQISSNNVIKVAATDFFYFYWLFFSPGHGIPNDTFTVDYRGDDMLYFYIDATTKKLIDVDCNLYYWELGYSHTFTPAS